MPELKPTTLITERLALRWLTADDAAAQFALFSDPAVGRYWSTPAWTDIAEARAFIEKTQADYDSGNGARFAITLRASDEVIGNITLYDFFDQNRRCDIGYALLPAHWGKGYLAAALAATVAYGFGELNLNRIEADIDPRNEGACVADAQQAFQFSPIAAICPARQPIRPRNMHFVGHPWMPTLVLATVASSTNVQWRNK